MKFNMQVKAALVAAMAVGATAVAQADLADDLMKQMDAEIAQVKEATKTEVAKETVASVVKSVEAAQKAEDAGSEAVVAAQEQPKVAEAKVDVPSSFDVSEEVKQKTAEMLKVKVEEIGNFNHKTGRIVVIGEAQMPMDVKNDSKGKWAQKRTMLAKSAILDAKLELVNKLSVELTAEEQLKTFNMPATSNTTEKTVTKMTSAAQFASSHPIMGATLLQQKESLIDGMYKIAVSLVWSAALQKSAVATMCGTPGFKEATKGKRSLGEWVEFQENPYLLIGPFQYLDNEGVRHFIGVSAMPIIKNKVAVSRANKILAKRDAQLSAAFSCLSDVNMADAIEQTMSLYDDPNSDAVTKVEISNKVSSFLSQKIDKQDITGFATVFEKEIEHPLFPGGRLYVYGAELNAESVAKARELSKKAYLERAKIAYENERFKAIKEKYKAQIEQAKRDGRAAGQRAKIEKYKTDDAARAKARLEKLKAIAAEAKANKAAAKAKLDQIREEMKAAGVYERYKKFVEAIDGMCGGVKFDPDDVNVD